MKRFFKSILKFTAVLILSGIVLLTIGVFIPVKTYKQKSQKTSDFLVSNCHIVDVLNDTILENRNILVLKGRIVSIDCVKINIPKGVQVIDAKEKYLMPSLWDMHMHTLSLSPQLHFPLLIAHGVTGVRDMGDGDSWISDIDDTSERDRSKWEKQEKSEKLLMPRIYESTSFHVEELDDISEENYKTLTHELVTKLKSRNESFVKVQLDGADLPPYMFYELQNQSRIANIPILGHLSPNVDIEKVLNNSFKSIEHAWALIPHCIKVKKEFEKDIDQKKYDLGNQDPVISKRVMQMIAKSGTYYCPTHVTSNRKEFMVYDPNFSRSSNKKYTENTQLFFWKLANWLHRKGYDQKTDVPILKQYYDRGLEITKLAHESGVKILAGTDAIDRNVYYGISLHEELQEMVKVGLTNAEALKTATYNAAEYYGLTNDYGSIAVGKKADFLLLNGNPLEQIENTQTISSVFYNERMYEKNDLENMKSFVSNHAKSFGITCKFIWNMIKRS